MPKGDGIRRKSTKKSWNIFFQHFGGRAILPELDSTEKEAFFQNKYYENIYFYDVLFFFLNDAAKH
jgi:hypothetical protein